MNINSLKLYGSIIWIIFITMIYIAFFYKHRLNNAEILISLLTLILLLKLISYINFYILTLKKKHKNSVAKFIIVLLIIVLLSYYLTRWKLINGPFNYSDYFGKPEKNFEGIYKNNA